jgi:hypothetical protein
MSSMTSGTDLPLVVTVGPHPYAMRYVSGLMHEDGDALLGLCATDDLVIQLEEKQPTSLLRETVLHELVHAIASQFGLSDENTEEEWANAVGVGMLQVLRQNPRLVSWLVAP